VLFAVGAVVLGGALALVLRGSPAETPAAPASTELAVPAAAPASPEPVAQPAPPAAPVAALAAPVAAAPAKETPPPAPVEIGLDPGGIARLRAQTPHADEPRPRHHHHEHAEESPEAPATDDLAKYRNLGLSLEMQGRPKEALAAYQQALAVATRSRDRQQIARRMYDLAHPGE